MALALTPFAGAQAAGARTPPLARRLVPFVIAGLFGLCVAFAFLSAAMAAELGVQRLRIPLFAGVTVALFACAVGAAPRFSARGALMPLVLAALLGVMALRDTLGGVLDPLAYKLVLPVLALLFAPNVARCVAPERLLAVLWGLLAVYVTVSATALLGGGALRLHDVGPALRFDLSGSVIQHASLCFFAMLLSLERLSRPLPTHEKALALLLATVALALALLTGTRTILLSLAFVGAAWWWHARHPVHAGLRLALLMVAGLVAFALYTAFISDNFLLRLAGFEGGDYTSGRAQSLAFWLEEAAAHPFGIGLGGIGALLEESRARLPDGAMLEWPHNEFVRLFVEGGWPGLAFILGLVGVCVGRAFRLLRRHPHTGLRLFAAAVAGDLIARSLVQNYFNSVYLATPLILLLATADAALWQRRGAGTGGDEAHRRFPLS